MRKEIRIAGFGGQGIVLAGKILGEAAINAGFKAVQTQSYGPESRGGAARSEVVISDKNVDYPRVMEADVFVALSQPGYDKYRTDITKKALTVIDADLVESSDKRLKRVSFTKIADSLGKKIVANIVMLGYLTALLEAVPKRTMKETIKENIPRGTERINLAAFEEGYKRGMKAGKG